MNEQKTKLESYFDLAEHSSTQKLLFVAVFIAGVVLVFLGAFLPLMEFLFRVYLEGIVYNKTGEILQDVIDPKKTKTMNYITLWAIDIYKKTPQETRYWFEPITSLLIPSLIFGVGAAIYSTTLLNPKFGFMRQKIEREIANFISKIAYSENEHYSDDPTEIEDRIISANLRELYTLSEKWKINVEDLKALRRALIWKNSNIITQILKINDGLTMYMRYYFTVKYGNAVLGLVYMGAAVLIIIIGLRGLKFIPSTQPSLVFFALGLEFSLLITYAFTLMYGKQDEETGTLTTSTESDHLELFSASKPVNSKEAENLLRLFMKK